MNKIFNYDGIRQYLEILIHNDELNEAKNVIDKIITLINADDSDNKNEISKFSIFKLEIFILEEDNNSFKTLFDKYEQNDDLQYIRKLKRSIDKVEEKSLKDIMVDINYIYPVSMTKKIHNHLKI
jgi:hypothetical protein